MATPKTQIKRRRLAHTTMKELRSIKSAPAAMRIVDQYSKAAGDFLLEVCSVLTEIADRLPKEEWEKFTETCLTEHGVLFRTIEHMKVMLAVGRAHLPENALKASLLRGVGASYLNILQTRMEEGKITKAKVVKAIDDSIQQADPTPMADALGYKRAKLPAKKPNATPYLTDVELTETNVVMVTVSTGLRVRVSSGKLVQDLLKLWKRKQQGK